jgi:hypothetical protein
MNLSKCVLGTIMLVSITTQAEPLISYEITSGPVTEKILIETDGTATWIFEQDGKTVKNHLAKLDAKVMQGLTNIAQGASSNLHMQEATIENCQALPQQTYRVYSANAQSSQIFFSTDGCKTSEDKGRLQGYILMMKRTLDGLYNESKFLMPFVG